MQAGWSSIDPICSRLELHVHLRYRVRLMKPTACHRRGPHLSTLRVTESILSIRVEHSGRWHTEWIDMIPSRELS